MALWRNSLKKSENNALSQLAEIIKIRDTESAYNPELLRQQALEQWIGDWVVEVEEEQLVLDKAHLTSDNSDLCKWKLTEQLAEKVAEDCTVFSEESRGTKGTVLKAKLLGLRRKAK